MQLVSEIDSMLHAQIEMYNFFNGELDQSLQLAKTIDEMFDIIVSTHGIGLAAPQVGLSLRLFIMEIDLRRFVCINPTIVSHELEETVHEEGCLSFPLLQIKVKRVDNITVKYYDGKGNEQSEVLTGLASRCFQHELDHLNGITFDQKVSKMVLDMAKRRRVKQQKKGIK